MATIRELVWYMEQLRIEFYENAHTLTTNPGGQIPICLLIHLVKANRKTGFLLNRRQVNILHGILCTFIEWQNDEEDRDHENPCSFAPDRNTNNRCL